MPELRTNVLSFAFSTCMYVVADLMEGVCTIGPVDTALIDLTRREGGALLTDDATLARRAWKVGVDCRLIYNLISQRRE